MGEASPFTVAAIGDLHVTESASGRYRDMFRAISERADVLALCGDLTNLGGLTEARTLADELSACTIPIVGVLGNHDLECGQGEEVEHILRDAGLKFLEHHVQVIDGVGFAGVKGFGGGFDDRMLSPFGEPAIKQFVNEALTEAMRLETALRALTTERIVVVLHYAPIAATVAGEPREIFPFLGSSRLAETIDRFPVNAVVHGHAHHGTFEGRTAKGIPVYNCAQPVVKDGDLPYALIRI